MNDIIDIKLHKVDIIIVNALPISSINYYNGNIPREYIRNKVKLLIQSNPWLEGRLIKNNEGYYNQYKINPDYNTLIETEITDLKSNIEEINDINKQISEFILPHTGNMFNNPSIKLFQIVLIYINSNQFALLVSMNHCLGDGDTFYKILSMLDKDTSVYSLIYDKIDESYIESIFPPKVKKVREYSLSPAYIFNILRHMFFYSKPDLILRVVDNDWIIHEKNNYNAKLSNGEYVSSNDILTSWLFRLFNSTINFMAVNYRGRLVNYPATNLHAGNYQGINLYIKEDIQPIDIRTSIKSHTIPDEIIFPNFFSTIFSSTTMITSSVQLYQQIELPDSEFIFHTRVFDISSYSSPYDYYCIVFKPSVQSIAFFVITSYGEVLKNNKDFQIFKSYLN